MVLLKASGRVYSPTHLPFPSLFPHFSAGKMLSPTTQLQLNGKVEGEKQGEAKRNRFEAREREQMGVNEAQKYKEKAAPASGSCQGEGSMPGKGWKRDGKGMEKNIPTGDRAQGASTDEEGDVCSSLNALSGRGRGWGGSVFLWNLRSQKSQILHKAAALVYPKSQTTLSRTSCSAVSNNSATSPSSQDSFPNWLFQKNHGTGKMRT